jgi:hypothetical protein
LISWSVLANDTFVTLGAGGLIPIKATSILMVSEDLNISPHLITVKYVFRNESNSDVNATVAFPLPELDGAEVENSPIEIPSKDPLNFVNFKVVVNGRSVSPRVEVRAFKNDREITARLRSLGLPLSVHDPAYANAVKKLSPAIREQLRKEEIIVDEENKKNGVSEHWPWWQTRVQFYWVQRFPAHEEIVVTHSYRPVVGGGYFYSGIGRAGDKEYCGGPEIQQQLDRLPRKYPATKKDEIQFYERQIRYILTTANNWKGPIRRFHLTVETDSPDDVLVTCEKDLKRTGPTRYEASRVNFHPQHELELLILQRQNPLKNQHTQ